MKGRWIGVLVVIVLVVAAGVFFVTDRVEKAKIHAGLVSIFTETVKVIEEFHSDLQTGLSPSLSAKAELEQEMSKMKNIAEEALTKIDELRIKANTFPSPEANSVIEMVAKSRKYILGYSQLSEQRANRNNIVTFSQAMLIGMDKTKNQLRLAGSLDEGDVILTLDRACKLANNYQKACQAASSPPPVIVLSYPSWVISQEQRGAFDIVRQIAQEIVQSRRYLGSKANIDWSMGKRGHWGYFEQSRIQNIFQAAREEKYRQLRTIKAIQDIEGMSELSSVVEQMLLNAIYAFEAMLGDANYGVFNAYNRRNNALAEQLKRRWGIVAR